MRKKALLLPVVIGILALSLTAGTQPGTRRGVGAPIRALGPAPKGPVVDQSQARVQAPTNTSLGYRGVVAADFNASNDATNRDELAVDFGPQGLWIMEGYSPDYDNAWNMISGINPEAMLSARFVAGTGEALIGDFGALGLWKWTRGAGYPGTWTQLSGANPDGGFAVDDDGDGLHELQFDFGTLGLWRYDDNGGGAGMWDQYSSLNPALGYRVATVTTASEQGVWSFAAVGTWKFSWSAGPRYAQLTGTPLGGNDDASGLFTGGAGEDAVMDFGALGLWLLKNNTAAEWHQIIPQQTSFAVKARLPGNTKERVAFVYQGTPGLFIWGHTASFPGAITSIQALSPDADGAVEAFDPDGATNTGAGDELAVDMGLSGLWLYDAATAGWAQLNTGNPVFMIGASFWNDPAKTTLIVDLGAQGLWLYDGSYDYWWPISSFSPEANYGF